MKLKYKYLIFFFTGIVIISLSILSGTKFISPGDLIGILNDKDHIFYKIILDVRIPRILLSLIVGASLAVSGTLFQSLLKNPLADPYIIGVSSGAGLGVSFAIIFNLSYPLIILFSFIGGLATIIIIFFISMKQKFGSESLILSGIALSFIFSSSILLIFAISKPKDVHKVLMWLMGDLSIARYNILLPVGIIIIILILLAVVYHKHLDIISFGENFYYNTGVKSGDVKIIFFIAAFLASLSISIAGVIGFVGLIIPHIIRNIFGPSHLKLIPFAAISGALMLTGSDAIGRFIVSPYEIPVGIITGFSGGIFFLLYMNSSKRN